jgi:hypothetical protein
MAETGVIFWHNIAGQQTITLQSNLRIGAQKKVTAIIPTLRDAGVTFSHSIAGTQVLKFEAQFGITTGRDEKLSLTKHHLANLVISPTLSDRFALYRQFEANLGISATLSLVLNAGYTDLIMFGDLILRRGRELDWQEYDLSTREADIWDGSKSLEVMPITGYNGKVRFYPIDYNDIKTFLAMVGTPFTLRIFGVPYRNVYIWGKPRKKQFKSQVAMWVVEAEFKQDTCRTESTA